MPFACFSSIAGFGGDFGGSSPGCKVNSVLKNSPVR